MCAVLTRAHPETRCLYLAVTYQTHHWLMMVAGRSASREAVQKVQPADIHRALHAMLAGRSARASMPLLAAKRARCVQRSGDLADLYGIFCDTSQRCADDMACQARAESAKRTLLEGAQKLVLAMVEKVGCHSAACTKNAAVFNVSSAMQRPRSCALYSQSTGRVHELPPQLPGSCCLDHVIHAEKCRFVHKVTGMLTGL